MNKVRKEMVRLADLEHETREWIKREGIDTMFDYYYDNRIYNTKQNTSVTLSRQHLKANTVSAAMDISNYTTDNIGSEIADHTFTQDCAWRRRMHKENSKVFSIEQILCTPPAPLGLHSKKKRKHRVSHPTQNKNKRRKVVAEKTLPAKRKRSKKHN